MISNWEFGYFSPGSETMSERQTSSTEQVVRSSLPKDGELDPIRKTTASMLDSAYCLGMARKQV